MYTDKEDFKSWLYPRSQVLEGEEGAPGTHCLHMRLIIDRFLSCVVSSTFDHTHGQWYAIKSLGF